MTNYIVYMKIHLHLTNYYNWTRVMCSCVNTLIVIRMFLRNDVVGYYDVYNRVMFSRVNTLIVIRMFCKMMWLTIMMYRTNYMVSFII